MSHLNFNAKNDFHSCLPISKRVGWSSGFARLLDVNICKKKTKIRHFSSRQQKWPKNKKARTRRARQFSWSPQAVKSRYLLLLPHNFGTLGKREVRWGLLKLHHFCPCRLDLLRIFLVVLLATLMMLLDSLCGSHCSLDSSHLHSTKPSNVKKWKNPLISFHYFAKGQ